MRFDRGSIMAPIGSPSKMTGRDQLSIGGLGGGMDFDTSQFLTKSDLPTFDTSQFLTKGDLPTAFDDRALRKRIGAIEDRYTTGFDELNRSIGNIPSYDDSALRDRLSALEGREIPTFDPSNLQSGIAGLRDRLDNLNIPEYKAPDLSGFARLEDLPQIDTSKFLTAGDLPEFDPRDFREDFLSIAREGIQLPEYKAPDLSGFARKEDLPVFDKEAFEKEILDKMRGSIDVSPKPPVFDRQKLIEDVKAGIDIPQAPAFDPTGLQDKLKQLEERISGLQTPALPEPAPVGGGLFADPATRVATAGPGGIGARPDLPEPAEKAFFGKMIEPPMSIGGIGGGNRLPEVTPITEDPSVIADRNARTEYSNQLRAGGDAFRAAFPDAPQRPQVGTMDIRMYIDPITGEQKTGSSTDISYRNRLKEYLDANPAAMESYQQNVLSIQKPESMIQGPRPVRGGPAIPPGGPVPIRPDLLPPKRGDQLFIDDRPSDPRIQGGPVDLPDLTTTQPVPVTDPVTTAPTPSAPISDQGTDPIQSMPVGALDPVLLGQTSQETLTDPLVRALYFGTADQPGFYQQLQQAGANLIGQDVPLQQTAGLTPLELLARQQAVAGLGGFEPFLQQNRELINQAIAQSRRAEELQDPYYTQAEEIYKDTMGAYDPSMTQQFYNPFEDAVVQQTIQDVMEAGEKQDIASRAREISAGAFGGSRARLGAMERQEALGEGLAQALGAIRQRGFSEAQRTGLSEFARQQAAKRTGAQGLIGIGTGRGSAASSLGQQLAGYGGELSGLGAAQEQLRAGQRGELAGFGATGRGIAETGLSRIYQQQLGQQQRPLGVLGQIGSMLPGYQQTSTQIGSQYGLPTDPSAAGLGAAFSAYGALAPRQGQS